MKTEFSYPHDQLLTITEEHKCRGPILFLRKISIQVNDIFLWNNAGKPKSSEKELMAL